MRPRQPGCTGDPTPGLQARGGAAGWYRRALAVQRGPERDSRDTLWPRLQLRLPIPTASYLTTLSPTGAPDDPRSATLDLERPPQPQFLQVPAALGPAAGAQAVGAQAVGHVSAAALVEA